jgi:hypothetical protein
MLIAMMRRQGIGAVGERPPGRCVWRRRPGTATTIAFFRSGLDPR